MKILITGGAGFIGFHLATKLANDGNEIVLADDFSRGVRDRFLRELEARENVTFVSADLMDSDALKSLGGGFEYIYHLAAIIGVQNVLEHSYDVLRKNVELLLHVIDFAKEQPNLKRLIFASTSEVYAGTLKFYDMEIPTPETTPLTITPLASPRTSYMLSKIYGEALLNQSALPYTIIRPHNFYGPRMGMSHVIPELLKKAHSLHDGDALEVFSVDHRRTFCYIEDAIEMITRLALADESAGQAYNIGNEMPEIPIRDVAECVIKTVGKDLVIKEMPATEGSPARRCPSMKKTAACIGYIGRVSLEEGVRNTYDWYRDNIFDGSEMSAK